ncbi:haloacid dehalogenase-like hydrolase [Flavobacteriaceae bacterium]|nr:haloacid dehalogenase-like hydrolase [Flavobacteriaceae bacterium]
MKNKNIVVFDFDGTLIKGDSIKLYCKWISSNLLDFILRYHLIFRLIKLFKFKYDLKHERVKYFHKKQLKRKLDIDEFNSILKDHLFEDSLKLLKNDQLNHEVYVVSASFSEIIESFCVEFLKVKLITNNIKNYNTLNDINFKNKITALKSNINGDYNIVRGYGNSSGDFDFMQISEKAFLRLQNGENVIWKK